MDALTWIVGGGLFLIILGLISIENTLKAMYRDWWELHRDDVEYNRTKRIEEMMGKQKDK